jgi:hypothetical protein
MNRDLFERRPVVLLVLLVLLFFWKLSFSDQFTFLDSPDLAYQVLPWYQVQARSWHDGVFPMWDPYQWAGQSILGQVQPGAAFPLNWPLFLAPLEDGYINLRYIHWHYVFMHLLAGLFLYALVRGLGRSRFASLLAGLAFSFAGHVGSVNWPQMLNGAIWLPLVFLLFHKAEQAAWGLRAAVFATLCGGAIGMALLSGHHQAPTFMLLALGGMFLYFVYQRRETPAAALRFGGLFALVAVAAFVVSALQLLPALEYGGASYRWVGAPSPVSFDEKVPYYVQYPLRVYPVSLLGLIIPSLHFEANTFIGLVCATMALLAVTAGWRERWVRVYACLAVVALAYSFGPYSILHGWIYNFFPMADKARHAGHSIYIFQFAVMVLAAHGIDRFFQQQDAPDDARERWLTYLQRGLIVFGLLSWVFLLHGAMNARMGATEDRFMMATLGAFLLAGLIHGLRKGLLSRFAVRACILSLMIFELHSPNWYQLLHRKNPESGGFLAKLDEMRGPIEFLKSQPRPFRFMKRSDETLPNYGSWDGVEAVDGYLASVSSDLYDFFSKDWTQRRLMMNTVYVLSKEKGPPEEIEVFGDHTGWKVFRNPNAWPRAWIEHTPQNITEPAGGAQAPAVEACKSEEPVTVTRQTMHRANLSARLSCAGYVVLADPFYPGWTASVDGAPTTVYRAYGALRAVHVPAGEHTMEFLFRPPSVYWGGALTGAGLLACLALSLFGWWRGLFREDAEPRVEPARDVLPAPQTAD